MSPDPLTTAEALHPDLRWRRNRRTITGTSGDRRVALVPGAVFIGRRRAAGWRATHTEPHPGATIEALAAEAVDLRRAIGWPVEVAS